MVEKITRKDACMFGGAVLRCGFCKLQTLLEWFDRFGYNAGTYGWNFDAYRVPGGATICTGYRNMPGRDMVGCDDAERAARAVVRDCSADPAAVQAAMDEIMLELVQRNT